MSRYLTLAAQLGVVALVTAGAGWLLYPYLGAIASALGCTAIAGFGMGFCCCGTDTVPCFCCDGGNAPIEITVTVSGIANFTCATCTSLNGTYIFDMSATGCGDNIAIGPYCPSGLGYDYFVEIGLSLCYFGGTDKAVIFTRSDLAQLTFFIEHGLTDCTTLNDDLPLDHTGVQPCDIGGAVVHVTS